jgi:hypothetical protein
MLAMLAVFPTLPIFLSRLFTLIHKPLFLGFPLEPPTLPTLAQIPCAAVDLTRQHKRQHTPT